MHKIFATFSPKSIIGIRMAILLASCLAIAIVYLCLTIVTPFDSGDNAGTLQSLSVDEKTFMQIKEKRRESALKPQTIEFAGHELFYDVPEKTYLYSAIGSGERSFNPVVSLQDDENELSLAFLSCPITEESIRNNYRHAFIVYNDKEYTEYTFAVTTLPVISITTRHPEVLRDTFIGDKKSAAHMAVFDNDEHASHVQRVITTDIDIRIRGATSRYNPQKSYRVFLTQLSLGRNKRINPLSLLGMRQDEDWILYAPYSEPDKMRNVMSTNLWRAMGASNNSFGVDNGTEAKYVELFINGRYQGIYALMPPVDYKQLRMEISDDPHKTEYFYRKVSNTAAITHDFHERMHRNYHMGFELRYPKKTRNSYAKWYPLGSYVEILGGTKEFYEDNFLTAVEVENAIDFWLFVNLTMGVDNIEKNVSYIAKHNESGYVMLFSPWDMDQTWGYEWSGTGTLLSSIPGAFAEGLWIHEEMPIGRALLYNSFSIWNRVANRWQELRNTVLSDSAMEELIARHAKDVFSSGAFLRDYGKWRNTNQEETPSSLKTTIMRRITAMDREIVRIRANPASLRPEPLPYGTGP